MWFRLSRVLFRLGLVLFRLGRVLFRLGRVLLDPSVVLLDPSHRWPDLDVRLLADQAVDLKKTSCPAPRSSCFRQ